MGELFGPAQGIEKRVVDQVLAQIGPTFESILMQEIDKKRLIEVIKRNEVRDANQLTDSLISKMLDDYNGSTSLDFIGPVGRPGTSSAATDCMDVVPYGPLLPSSKTEEEDISAALSNSVLEQQTGGPSTSGDSANNEEEKIRDLNKTTGLNNQGNTCWFNALTQMLFSIPKFRSILYHAPPCTWHQTPITNVQLEKLPNAELLLQYRKLLAEMYFSEESDIPVGEVLTTVDRLYTANGGRSTINLQQDASEMLTLIVDWLGVAINAAIYAHLHPDFSNVSVEDANMVVSQSTELPPNSEMAGTTPPGYEEKVPIAGMPSTSAVQRDPESRANSPVRTGPARDAYGVPKAKSPKQSPPDLEPIEEAMDTSDGPAEVAQVTPVVQEVKQEEVELMSPRAVKSEFAQPEPIVEEPPEKMNNLVESLKNDTAAIFESTLYTEKFDFNGVVEGEVNTQVNCPVCFPLPVSYGNLHDGLESFTFGNRTENGVTVNTRAMYNDLPAVFFVSLMRFHATAMGGYKLHDRFTFPREVYMDRYLRKNVDLVMQLRSRLMDLRDELAFIRAKIAGLKRYPTSNGIETMDLVQAVETVMLAMGNTPLPLQEDHNPMDRPPNFVKTFFKDIPSFHPQQIPMVEEVHRGLKHTFDYLSDYEQRLNAEVQRLTWEIDNIYEVDELKNEMYELKAMIIHSGEMNRGHYWTYKLKRSIDGLEEWEKLNDSNTEKVDYSRIEQEAFGTGFQDAPSAYLLLYVRKDATWLMSADNETRAESLSNLPSDLQAHVEEKCNEWRRRLADYREGKTSTILKPQPVYGTTTQASVPAETPMTFAWYRSEREMESDENANPDRKICLERRLDTYDVPISEAPEMQIMESLIQSLWTMALNFDRDSYGNPVDLLDWHLRGTMEGYTGGKKFIEDHLNMSIKELRSDAENDIEQAYNYFIMEYISRMCHLESDWRSRFVVFVATQLPRIHTPVIRYLLVRSMAVSNLGVLKHRAQEELSGYQARSADKGASMERIAETLAHIYHMSLIAAANCRLSMENVKYFLDNDSSVMMSYKEREHAEKLYIAMVAARNARQTTQYLKARASFLEQPSLYSVNQFNLDTSTILAMLSALKMVLRVMVAPQETFQNFGVNLSINEQTLNAQMFVAEICIVLSLIRQWKNGMGGRNSEEKTELKTLHASLTNKFEFLMTSEKLGTEKMKYAQDLYSALTDEQSLWPDVVATDMRLPVQPGAGGDEWERIEKIFRQMDPIKAKVDSLLTAIDEIITKLWS